MPGVDFDKHQREGIDVEEFGGLMMVSGLSLCEEVRWISFHSYFDFGYLVKVLTNSKLPEKESDFFALLSDYFPCFFDIKYIMKSCESLKGGLNRIAETLEGFFFLAANLSRAVFDRIAETLEGLLSVFTAWAEGGGGM